MPALKETYPLPWAKCGVKKIGSFEYNTVDITVAGSSVEICTNRS
jgi:hypothetical protein